MKKVALVLLMLIGLVGSAFAKPKKVSSNKFAEYGLNGTVWSAEVGSANRAVTFDDGIDSLNAVMIYFEVGGMKYTYAEHSRVNEYKGNEDAKWLITNYGGYITSVGNFVAVVYEYRGYIYTVLYM